jgi:hypothetical protein
VRLKAGPLLRRAAETGGTLVFGTDALARTVAASEIAAALGSATAPDRRGITIVGADIDEQLNLEGLTFKAPMTFRGCTFGAGLNLRLSDIGRLFFDRCTIEVGPSAGASIVGGALRASDDILVHESRLDGALSLLRSTINGSLVVGQGCTIGVDQDRDSIVLDGATIGRNIAIGPSATVHGAVRFPGATVGGNFRITGGSIVGANKAEQSIYGRASKVEGWLEVTGEGTRLRGGTHLTRTHVADSIVLRASLGRDLNDISMLIDDAELGGNLLIGGPSSGACIGAIRVSSTRVRGEVVIAGVAIRPAIAGISLMADHLTVGRDVRVIGEGTHLEGGINLHAARITGDLTIALGARIGHGRDRFSLDGDVMRCGRLILRGVGTRCDGALRLNGATVEGQVSIRDASLGMTSEGLSLDADFMTVRGSVFVSGPAANLAGGIKAHSVQVAGNVTVQEGATVGRGPNGISLDLFSGRMENLVIRSGGTSLLGAIAISESRLALLQISGPVTVGASDDHFAVYASEVTVNIVEVAGALLRGCASFLASRINGNMTVSAATVGSTHDRSSLNLDNATVVGQAMLYEATILGAVYAEGASVSREFTVENCIIGSDHRGISLDAERAEFRSAFELQGTDTRLTGQLLLAGAKVSGPVHLSGVSIGESDRGWSVGAKGLTADSLTLADCRLDSGLDLSFSSVHIDVRLLTASVVNMRARRRSLHAMGLDTPRLMLRSQLGEGIVDLAESKIGSLDDVPEFWGLDGAATRPARLDGSSIGRLSGGQAFTGTQRLAWLHSAWSNATERVAPADRASFRVVAEAQSAAGEDDEATRTLMAMRRVHNPTWLRRLLTPIGQGYKPQWALWGLLLTFACTLGLTVFSHTQGEMVATGGLSPAETFDDRKPDRNLIRSRDCDPNEYPCLQPLVFSLDAMVPGVELGEAARWSTRTQRGALDQSSLIRTGFAALRLAGWALFALFVVGAVNVVLEQRRAR